MTLSPIILFVYNRPWHTQQTLEALMLNDLADQSILYIYCDGAKKDATEEQHQDVMKVRDLVKQKDWCQTVVIIERDINLGLANSVIQGVSEVIEKHGQVIVLEDDILTGKYFLNFMNDSLNVYSKEKKVFGVSGHQFKSLKKVNEPTYFLPVMSSWGYGTWLDRWQQVDFDSNQLLKIVETKNIGKQLDFGTIKYYKMLKDQVAGNIDSWAVRFYVSMFLKHGIFLYPNKKLIQNIGLDDSGVHCKKMSSEADLDIAISDELVSVQKMPVQLKKKLVDAFKINYKAKKKSTLKDLVLRMISPEIRSLIKRKLNLGTSKSSSEFEKIKQVPRYTRTSAIIDGYELIIPDSSSFLFMYDEIFKTEIYKFKTENESPYIIDGGANIGLATIYFKKLYPKAEIIAFEPDQIVYNILKQNIDTHNFETVELINKGLWNDNKTLSFKSEGADAGFLGTFCNDVSGNQIVSVTSLKPYLNRQVDFLKLDIEGAETTVLKDIAPNLNNVQRIFVEYHSFVGQKQTLHEILNVLTLGGFRLYVSSPGIKSKKPFIKINCYNNMDMQLNIYGFK